MLPRDMEATLVYLICLCNCKKAAGILENTGAINERLAPCFLALSVIGHKVYYALYTIFLSITWQFKLTLSDSVHLFIPT